MIETIIFCSSIIGVVTVGIIKCCIRNCNTSHEIYILEDIVDNNHTVNFELSGNNIETE